VSSPPPTATCAATYAKGAFRADLYHRLSVFTLSVPPLREMDGDKLALLEHFRRHFAAQAGVQPFELDAQALARWQQYEFPGNVRELRNIVIRLATKYAGQRLSSAELEPELDLEGGIALRPTRAAARSSSRRGASSSAPALSASTRRSGLGARLHRGGAAPDARQRQPGGEAARHQPHHALLPHGQQRGEIAVALYLEHFGLTEVPFRITPHTDFFFDGADRGATLEALIYAVLHDEGIVKVSGEVGSGKTMLCRVLMERLPKEVETIYLATPSLAKDEIIHAIGDDLKLAFSQERRTVALRELQEHLIDLYGKGPARGVLIDEAHVMPEDTLEQVRLLSNLESNRHKLLQIVLFGQPELDATLAKTELRQLRDRITHSFRMRPLSPAEVAKYISFRMRAAGYRGPDLFLPARPR
jgi:type II secretory pathway predicted ATPase ExeA